VALIVGCATGCVSPLGKAIRADDPQAVRDVLAQTKRNVNGRTYRNGHTFSGLTPLGSAVQQGRIAAARALIAAGADVNVQMAMGHLAVTPLGLAAGNGSVALVELLLEHGADVNAGQFMLRPLVFSFGRSGKRDVVARSPLLLAARAGHADVVRVLLAAGADVNLQAPCFVGAPSGAYGRPIEGPPLQAAAERREVATVELFLARGAQVAAPVRTLVPVYAGPPIRVDEPFSSWFLYDYDVSRDADSAAYFDILQRVLPLTRPRPAGAALLFSTNVMVTIDGVPCSAPPEGVNEIAPGVHTVEFKAVRLPRGLYVNVRMEEGAIPAQSVTFAAGRCYLFRPLLEREGKRKLVPTGVELLCF
jgi:hypothetical protein